MSSNGIDPKAPAPSLGEVFEAIIERAVSKAIQTARPKERVLLEPEELAAKLKVPVSWVYEQSRKNAIPTHRIGRYIRFDLEEVLASQNKK